jgi:hypothetical protein
MKSLSAPRAGFDIPERSGPSWLSSRWCLAALIVAVSVYYLFLLSNGTFLVFGPEMLDQTYNSMLVHMLHGNFDVDPKAIGFEAMTRNGTTYAYFGVFPALLRLPAMAFTDISRAELARLSCLSALVIFIAVQLRALLAVHNSLPAASRRPELLAVMAAAMLFSGPQIYILGSAAIYHESILWAAAMAAGFNLIVVRAAFAGYPLQGRDLVLLALLAGLAINTRPSIGLDLCLGAVLLIGWAGWERWAAHRDKREGVSQNTVTMPLPWLAIIIIGLLAAAAGAVNFARWGNPLTFADFHSYGEVQQRAIRAAVLRDYGDFNIGRVWIGALYYATGLPWLLKGVPPFAEFLQARVVAIEAPPLTPFLTNPIAVLFAAVGVYRVLWKSDLPARSLTMLRLVLAGHIVPVIIVFGFFYFTLRYRFDFVSFVTLALLIGYRSVSLMVGKARPEWARRCMIGGIVLMAVGIVFSHYALLMHKAWSMAVPMEVRLALVPFLPAAYLPVPSPSP